MLSVGSDDGKFGKFWGKTPSGVMMSVSKQPLKVNNVFDVTKPVIVARLDKLQCRIMATKENVKYLRKKFWKELVPMIARMIGNCVPSNPDFDKLCPDDMTSEPETRKDFKTRFRVFKAEDTNIWSFEIKSNDFLDRDLAVRIVGFTPEKKLRSGTWTQPPKNMLPALFTYWSDLSNIDWSEMPYGWSELDWQRMHEEFPDSYPLEPPRKADVGCIGLITFTNPRKLDFLDYFEQLVKLVAAVESKISLIPNRLEVAFDTTDKALGTLFRMNVFLKNRWNPEHVFYVLKKKKRGRKARGVKKKKFTKKTVREPTIGGINQYLGYRPKSAKDRRPSSVRPEGGGDQIFSDIKKVGDRTIYRTEYRAYRRRIRYFMEKYGLKTTVDLIVNFQIIILEKLQFAKLNMEKLLKDFPQFKRLKKTLEKFSAIGQANILKRAGVFKTVNRKEKGSVVTKVIDSWRDYFTSEPFPPILYLSRIGDVQEAMLQIENGIINELSLSESYEYALEHALY